MARKLEKKSCVKSSASEKELAELKLKTIHEEEVRKCIEEYNKAVEPILKKYECMIVIQGQFVGDTVNSGLAIVKAK